MKTGRRGKNRPLGQGHTAPKQLSWDSACVQNLVLFNPVLYCSPSLSYLSLRSVKKMHLGDAKGFAQGYRVLVTKGDTALLIRSPELCTALNPTSDPAGPGLPNPCLSHLGSWAHSSGLLPTPPGGWENPGLPATSCPGWLQTCVQQHDFLGNFSGPSFPWAESLQLILVFLAETVRGK